MRGRNVMMGYKGMPEKTASAIDGEGWLRSGDLVSIDDCARPTTVSVGLVRTGFLSSLFFYFLAFVLGCQNGTKTEIFARFVAFFEGTILVPFLRYEKVSQRYILGSI